MGTRLLLIPLLLASVAVADSWRPLAPGLELADFKIERGTVRVLRVDPDRWQTVALAVSDVGGEPRPVHEWAQEFELTAVINAGMFALDRRTHTGYFRVGDHVNSKLWNQIDYRQAACFEPRDTSLPRFVLHDLDAAAESTFAHRYDIVIQNLRLIRKPGENRWSPNTRSWTEACLGEDADGRMLWIHCTTPHDMHTFNEILLDLPLDLVAAQHLEGGAQAQLWVEGAAEDTPRRVPVPNVLGLRPRVED